MKIIKYTLYTLIIGSILYWLFFFTNKKETYHLQAKNYNQRICKTPSLVSTLKLPNQYIAFNVINDTQILMSPYLEKSTFLFHIINPKGEVKYNYPKLKNQRVLLNIALHNKLYSIITNEENAYLLFINLPTSKNTPIESSTNQINLPSNFHSFLNLYDSILIYTNTNDTFYNIYKYNFITHQCIDSLNLTSILPSKENIKSIIYFGRILNTSNSIIYKSIYSSFAVKISKNNFTQNKIFQTIDSLPLPKIKATELAPGITQHTVSPSLYPGWQILNSSSDNICILSFLGLNTNAHYLDTYDQNLQYISSLELPFQNGYRPYWVQYSQDRKYLYVLYDDYITFKKYKL